MNETNFEIVLDVLAREINMLRYQVKAAEDECEKLRIREDVLMAENEKLHAIVEEGCEKHE